MEKIELGDLRTEIERLLNTYSSQHKCSVTLTAKTDVVINRDTSGREYSAQSTLSEFGIKETRPE